MAQETYLTPEGLARLEEELEHLRTVRRREVAEALKRAAEMGTVDNAEYDEAKNDQARIEGRIRTLENLLKSAVIIADSGGPSDVVRVGSRVTVRTERGKEEHYTIVGSEEANPAEGKVSNVSPVGKALLGKRVGEVAEAQVPAGKLRLTVLKIE